MADDRDLLPGETVLLSLHRHPVVILKRVLLPLAAMIVVLGVGSLLTINYRATVGWFVLMALLLAFLVYVDIHWIIWRSETLTVTDQRVLYRRGVFGRFSRSTGLARVQDVTTAQGLLGRVLNYGTVEVESAARDGAEVFDHVPDPAHFRNVLFEQLHQGGHAVTPQGW